MSIEFNDRALREMFEDIGPRIEGADARFREQYEGQALEDIQPAVHGWFAGIGIDLTDQNASEYAAAVAGREPFEWVLR